jgi:dynactin-5
MNIVYLLRMLSRNYCAFVYYIMVLTEVSRRADVDGARHVEMKGKSVILSHATVRGDIAKIRMGRYSCIGPHTTVQPSAQNQPMSIGSYTRIGSHSVVEAASVGSSVVIGNHVKIGPRVLIKDCCHILDGTVVPPDTVIPPFSLVGGTPSKIIQDMPESTAVIYVEESVQEYTTFVHNITTNNQISSTISP